MSKTDLISAYIIISSHIWIWNLDLINGAHSCSAIRGSFSIDNGDSSQNITFKIRVVKLVFGSKNQDFFPKQQFFFQTQGYQNTWPIEALKKAEKRFSLYLHLPDFYQVWKIAGQISRLFQEFKTLCEPRKWICIFSNFGAFVSFQWECRMWVNFAAVDFLEMVLRKKKIVVAYLFPP